MLDINLKKIRDNLIELKRQVGVRLMLMVKSNAYGHGLEEVAGYVEDVVDAFGVETIEEGISLRRAGIAKDILLLACGTDEIFCAYKHSLTIGVHNIEQVQGLIELAKCKKISLDSLKIHVKLDSGMHRLGFDEHSLTCALALLKGWNIPVEGVYSHLRDGTLAQREGFEGLSQIVLDSYPNAIRHIASSHSMGQKCLRYDMVRAGICAYKGAMSAKSTVLESRYVHKGESVGYGYLPLAHSTGVAIVFGGYADGILREKPPCVSINGKKYAPIGNACMDVFAVDTGEYMAKVGEAVTLFDSESIDEAAKDRNTIAYCIMTSLHGRVNRCYDG